MLGLLWEFDHIRYLGWKEYLYWMNEPLPFGWTIISTPDKGAEIIDEQLFDKQALTQLKGYKSRRGRPLVVV